MRVSHRCVYQCQFADLVLPVGPTEVILTTGKQQRLSKRFTLKDNVCFPLQYFEMICSTLARLTLGSAILPHTFNCQILTMGVFYVAIFESP